MISFNNKKINAIKTLGEKLQEHRLSYGLSLEEISRMTQININYLSALENDKFNLLPPDVYTKNFLRQYADYLDLNPDTVIESYEQEKSVYFKTQKRLSKEKRNKQGLFIKTINFFLKPQFLKYSLAMFVTAALLFYIGWGINRIFTPPALKIFEPADSLITTERHVNVRGETEKEVLLTINGQEIISDQHGVFESPLDLQKGLNIIKISAQKKHSRENIKYLQIIVEETANVSKN
ncbi:MAG: helix-turn-helix domain-containing protein [Patescibacteria group bacterium]